MNLFIGIDIGGTKSAVVLASEENENIKIVERTQFATLSWRECIAKFFDIIEELLAKHNVAIDNIRGIGISCGGPLDSKRGVIMSPPNLIGWDNVEIVKIFKEKFGVPTFIQNDDRIYL